MSNIRTYRANQTMQMISVPLHSTTNNYHLDNNREVVDAKGRILQRTNYYAFGLTSEESSSSIQPYKYNGKEFDNMHGLNTYDYGARQYNPVTARWDRMDPLCEKYYSTSPYAYCMNNLVRFIDPDGRTPRIYIDGTGLGHAFVTIGEGENTVVYTYGRYGALGSSGSILRSGTPSGEGVLIKKQAKKHKSILMKNWKKVICLYIQSIIQKMKMSLIFLMHYGIREHTQQTRKRNRIKIQMQK